MKKALEFMIDFSQFLAGVGVFAVGIMICIAIYKGEQRKEKAAEQQQAVMRCAK